MSRRGRAREQHDIDPVRLPKNVDVGRGRDRVVCIRLDDLRTSIPQLVREAFPRDPGAGQEDRSPAHVAECTRDGIGQEFVRDQGHGQARCLRGRFCRGAYGRDLSLEAGQVHA